jgi:hypothetical protein
MSFSFASAVANKKTFFTPNKDINATKKKQSDLKTTVQNFGKLLMSWRKDVKQIEILLSNLCDLCSILDTIERNRSKWLNSRTVAHYLIEQRSDIIISKLYVDVEVIYSQLKALWYVLRSFGSS